MRAEAIPEAHDEWAAVAHARARLDAAVLPGELLRALRRDIRLTQGTIAAACGTTDRSVRNWEQGAVIRRRNADKLRALADAVLILAETLTRTGIEQWLWANLRLLHGARPVDVLRETAHGKVTEAARAFVEGSHV